MRPIVASSLLRNELEELTTDSSWCPQVLDRSDSLLACSIDHTGVPMSEQQAEALRVATRTLDDLADLVEEGLPTLDQSAYDRVIQDVSETDTQFARRWADIKACVDAHLEHLGGDESLDTMTYDYANVSGGHPPEGDHPPERGHPPENGEMKLTVQYYPEGRLTTRITVLNDPSLEQLGGSSRDTNSHFLPNRRGDRSQLDFYQHSESEF